MLYRKLEIRILGYLVSVVLKAKRQFDNAFKILSEKILTYAL